MYHLLMRERQVSYVFYNHKSLNTDHQLLKGKTVVNYATAESE